jgi:hypothetical protein
MILSFSFLGIGCTTTSHRDRGSLSDAMDKARDDYEGEREVPDEEKDDPPPYEKDRDDENDYDSNNDYRDSYSSDSTADPLGDPRMLLRGGQGFVNDPYFNSLFDGEILLGAGDEFVEIYVLAGLKTLTVQEDHSISLSIKPESFMLHAGIEGRFYPLPSFSFMSPYLMARLGGFFYFWTFLNPLTSGSDTISSDTVGGAFAGVGAGIDLLHTEYFRLGGQVIPEVYLFGEETSQGFQNDYFSAQGTVKWSVEAGWQF